MDLAVRRSLAHALLGCLLAVSVLFPGAAATAAPSALPLAPNAVPAIGQLFAPAEYTGKTLDAGAYDCVPASVAMVLQALQHEGLLSAAMTDAARYAAVRHLFRRSAPYAYRGISPDLAIQLVPLLTNQMLTATVLPLPAGQ